MNKDQSRSQPRLSATFYPGGVDDFSMPEVIAPSPQRIMPEVPGNIQDSLARLEIHSTPASRFSGLQSPPPIPHSQKPVPSQYPSRFSSLSAMPYGQEVDQEAQGSGLASGPGTQDEQDQPSLSPFPPIHNRPKNVPPSNEETEVILERARLPVLNSNDAEMQLQWAQDALTYVETAVQHELSVSSNQGSRPRTPRLEHQLLVNAVNIVSFLAEQHHPKAEFMRGMWLEFGRFNFRADKKEAFRCYSRAAQNGYARAEYRMGMQFESSNGMAKAIKHYTRGVDAGDSAAHYRLGMMTLLGQNGYPQDYKRAIKLLTIAAETSDENAPQGAYVLGLLQARELPQINVPEQFLPVNLNAARVNIEKAAYLGFAKAQTKMGAAYELCQLGCDFDPALSLHYNALAAKQGDPDAEMAISKWFLCGYEGLFEKNESLAYQYAQRAAQSGLATAEFAMGYFFEIGMYVPVDLKGADVWYRKASDHGNKDAAARIDGISRSKTLSRKDHEIVAIAKIKSQYGSQRGKRPDRSNRAAQSMPTIADDANDTSGYPKPSIIDNRQPLSIAGPPQRPVSTAPYPEDDRTVPRPGSASAGSHVMPDLHPAPSPIAPLVERHRKSSLSLDEPQRPYSTMDIMSGHGRGTPALRGRIASAGPGQQSYRKPGGPSYSASQPQLPRIDIGFSAPLDAQGADRRRRLQKAEVPNSGLSKSQPVKPDVPPDRLPPISMPSNHIPIRPQSSASNVPSERLSSRLAYMPPAQNSAGGNQVVAAQRRSSPHGQVGGHNASGKLVQQDSFPMMLGAQPGAPAPPPKGPQSVPATPASGTPAPSVAATVPGRVPGKGPQTFEEMGVPQTKKENECIVM